MKPPVRIHVESAEFEHDCRATTSIRIHSPTIVEKGKERLLMADTVSSEARSRNMAAIRSKDTEPEIFLRKKLFAEGYRYRKYSKNVPGHPDLYFAKYRTAVFVNGCFWHRHQNCKYAYMPKTRIEFWSEKFLQNVSHDAKVKAELSQAGFKCMIVWECSIRKMKKSEIIAKDIISRISKFFTSDEDYLEV